MCVAVRNTIVQRKKRIRKGNGFQTKCHRCRGYNDNNIKYNIKTLSVHSWRRTVGAIRIILFYIIGTAPKRELDGRRRRRRRR